MSAMVCKRSLEKELKVKRTLAAIELPLEAQDGNGTHWRLFRLKDRSVLWVIKVGGKQKLQMPAKTGGKDGLKFLKELFEKGVQGMLEPHMLVKERDVWAKDS
eukprot:446904-Amphidinium_carterae.1